MRRKDSLFKAIAVPALLGAIVVIIGFFNIWLAILATPIAYAISESLLS